MEKYASTIPIFGEQSREQNERLRIDCQTECPESAEALSSPEIMENTVDSHFEKHAGHWSTKTMTSLWTHAQRLLFYTSKTHPRVVMTSLSSALPQRGILLP